MERNFYSRWGELDLIAVKINESDYKNDMYFDETAEGMNADATIGQGNGVHFVDATHATTIPCCGVVISARNRLTPQFMGFL